MNFTDFPYIRPDLAAQEATFQIALQKLKDAANLDEARLAVADIQGQQRHLESMRMLASIRHSIDTKDAFYVEEAAFWDEHQPLVEGWYSQYYQAILASPYHQDMPDLLPDTFFKMAQQHLRTYSDEIVPLLQEENQLVTAYERLIAAAEIPFQGQMYNLSGLGPHMQSTDRAERQESSQAFWGYYAKHRDELADIYDRLVNVRHTMAQQLGYADFVEMGYDRMNRLDYDRQDVEVYRQEVLAHVVPLASKVYAAQAERLAVDQLAYYDLALEFPEGNAVPEGTAEEIVAKARQMYQEMSPETAEFFDFMLQHGLMDLETKPGKQGGGYCEYLPEFQSPFIFSNFNGTSADVDVLTHEVGHAFQVYSSRHITAPELIFPTSEAAEIHSMSMEFLAWPWMENFFGEGVERYKYSHLASAITFIPYGVLVDHFQHEVYEHPQWTPEEREAAWRRLEKQYTPWRDYTESAFLDVGGYWYRQLHIFSDPFYYIDYTLAQMVALQFWQKSFVEESPATWSQYLAICQVGGTKSFLELVTLADMQSPFEKGSLQEVIRVCADYLKTAHEGFMGQEGGEGNA